MMDHNTRILDKIKKCLALSQSSEPAEAAAALRQAQKLMELHGIDAAELRRAELDEAQIKSKVSVSRIKDWELSLLNLVAKSFGCRLMWKSSHSQSKDAYGQYILIGLKTQVQLAQYTAEVMQRRLIKARAQFTQSLSNLSRQDKTTEADGFCHGWVSAVSKTVYEFAMGDEAKQLIDEYYREKTGGRRAKIQARVAGEFGLQAGRQAGAGESIQRPVSGQNSENRRLQLS